MRSSWFVLGLMALAVGSADAQETRSILFIGNSFTFGSGSAVRFWRANTVTDLNEEGIGGVPALFKSFADQTELSYDVYLRPGVARRSTSISRRSSPRSRARLGTWSSPTRTARWTVRIRTTPRR
ncbi:MAG: hypothetical protein MK335_08560 [Gemmatimonadetes bacterium]|nr:hypothetical protein [Gemmatimonadota bacterium]